MGNRCVVTWSKSMNPKYRTDIGVYLHWNGGRDSVEAFLKYCELRRFHAGNYGAARFVQVVANFFGGGDYIGVDCCYKFLYAEEVDVSGVKIGDTVFVF